MPASLSVNLNKVALLRNSRGRDVPRLVDAVDRVLAAGAHGITLHPRLDQRHVRFDDLPVVASHLRQHHPGIELNIECEDDPGLIDRVLALRPDQCTLVPVSPGEITSDHGWRLPEQADRLRPVIARLKAAGIRTSCFADCDPRAVARFADLGVDRVELYTGPYAWAWGTPDQQQQQQQIEATAAAALEAGLALNAGHDLDRHNLEGLRGLEALSEVSIGHALISRSLEVGLATSVVELLIALGWPPPAVG